MMKAIHLDVISYSTYDAFIDTLKRFFACGRKSPKQFNDKAIKLARSNKELKILYE